MESLFVLFNTFVSRSEIKQLPLEFPGFYLVFCAAGVSEGCRRAAAVDGREV